MRVNLLREFCLRSGTCSRRLTLQSVIPCLLTTLAPHDCKLPRYGSSSLSFFRYDFQTQFRLYDTHSTFCEISYAISFNQASRHFWLNHPTTSSRPSVTSSKASIAISTLALDIVASSPTAYGDRVSYLSLGSWIGATSHFTYRHHLLTPHLTSSPPATGSHA